jgi:hypothetical protein
MILPVSRVALVDTLISFIHAKPWFLSAHVLTGTAPACPIMTGLSNSHERIGFFWGPSSKS